MREADEQFLERLRVEIEPLVGPRADFRRIELADAASDETVRIVLALDSPIGPSELVVEGETLIDAVARLPAEVATARLAGRARLSSGPWLPCPARTSSMSRISPGSV
jgi:hypothetical protein